MPRRTGAIIPNPINPSGTFRRVICIPASPDWIALVTGALYVLTQAWYWDAQTGDVDAVVERAKQMYFEYQDGSGECGNVAAFEVGMMMPFAGETPPTGWLKCDGSLVSRTTYAALFDVIGETYEAGDGTTTFGLPDGRGMFIMGAGVPFSGGTDFAIGTKTGTETITLEVTQIPSHHHSSLPAYASVFEVASGTLAYKSGGASIPEIVTGNTGGGMPHNNVPPTQVVGMWMIYAGDE